MSINNHDLHPMKKFIQLVVMGVSGSGKTTLAARLSGAIGARFIDADDFHPIANVEKMRRGIALTDDDRTPWLARLNDELRQSAHKNESVVLACSALRERYRDAIERGIDGVRWVFLDGSFEVIAARIRARSVASDHYMPESLLKSQFETLERPRAAIIVDVSLSSEAQLACVMASL
jgi:gluconokinase